MASSGGAPQPGSPRSSLGYAMEMTDQMRRALLQEDRNTINIKELRARVERKDDFHTKRIRCLTNPDRAFETLTPYAKLDLTIFCAQNLEPRNSWTNTSTVDASVSVFLDDVLLEGQGNRTFVVRGTTHPLWQHQMSVPIASPMSMLRLQVSDDQVTTKEDKGFVEVGIADIPYDTEIEGWLELRFQETLRLDSHKRYASHSAMREDMLWQDTAMAEKADAHQKKLKKGASLLGTSANVEDFKARKAVGQRALQKTKTLISGCSASCSGKPKNSSDASALLQEHDRGNAGELYVRFKLTKLVSRVDSLFALSLDMPVPKSYGEYEEEGPPPDRKTLDLQKAIDTILEFRIAIMEDFLFCIWYYVRYIACWRSPWISLPLVVTSFVVCWHQYYLTTILPSICAAMLFLNQFENLRKSMTRGGFNARLTADGFRRVAQWKSSSEMFQFLKRVVESDLHGSIKDAQKLRSIAATCFRDGNPTLKFEEMRALLKGMPDIVEFASLADDDRFVAGDKVLVDERHQATIEGAAGPNTWNLVFDGSSSPASPNGRQSGRQLEVVEASRIRRRQAASALGYAWLPGLLPLRIVNLIVDSVDGIKSLESSALLPIIGTLTEIVTWKRRFTASAICIVCSAISLVFILTIKTYEDDVGGDLSGDGCDTGLKEPEKVEEVIAWGIISFLRNVDNMIWITITVVVFIISARWLQFLKSIGRVFKRIGPDSVRSAPDNWAFFREDENLKASLANVSMLVGQWPSVANVSREFNDGLDAMKDRMARLQKEMPRLPGLGHFKLPDLSHPSDQPENAKDAGAQK